MRAAGRAPGPSVRAGHAVGVGRHAAARSGPHLGVRGPVPRRARRRRRRALARAAAAAAPRAARPRRKRRSPCLPVTNESEAKAVLAERRHSGASGAGVHQRRRSGECGANRMGFPVVAKIVSPDIAHKTEIGGVILDIRRMPAALEAAFDTLIDARVGGGAASAHRRRADRADAARRRRNHRRHPHGPGVRADGHVRPRRHGGRAVQGRRLRLGAAHPRARRSRWCAQVRSSRLLLGLARRPASTTRLRWSTPCAACPSSRREHAGELEGIDINPFVVRTSGRRLPRRADLPAAGALISTSDRKRRQHGLQDPLDLPSTTASPW